jgi:hypothetical protein
LIAYQVLAYPYAPGRQADHGSEDGGGKTSGSKHAYSYRDLRISEIDLWIALRAIKILWIALRAIKILRDGKKSSVKIFQNLKIFSSEDRDES